MTKDEEEFSIRDIVALRVMEHLINRKEADLTYSSSDDKVERIAAMAYKMANAMCKARLAAFT